MNLMRQRNIGLAGALLRSGPSTFARASLSTRPSIANVTAKIRPSPAKMTAGAPPTFASKVGAQQALSRVAAPLPTRCGRPGMGKRIATTQLTPFRLIRTHHDVDVALVGEFELVPRGGVALLLHYLVHVQVHLP